MINLFGFIGPQVFSRSRETPELFWNSKAWTTSCRDAAEIDAFTKRLESALRLFDEKYRVYQLLFKRNRQKIPHSFSGKPVVDCRDPAARGLLRSQSRRPFSLSIYFVVLCPALAARRSLAGAILEFPENPGRSMAELRAAFSSTASVRLNEAKSPRPKRFFVKRLKAFART